MFVQIEFLDWAVFALVLAITFAAVLWGQTLLKKQNTSEQNSTLELLLMGRQLTLPLFIATLVATWYGGIFGVAKIAFESGIYNWVTQGIFWYASYLIFAFFVFKRIKNFRAITLPDLLTRMVGPKAGAVAAYFNILNLVPIAYCISLGQLLHMLFGVEMITGTILGVTTVLAYSLFGGFRAVVFSDIVQFFVMISSVLLVFVFSLSTYGIAPLQTLPDHYFSPTGNHSISETILWGFLAMATLINPTFYQRAFAASSDKVVTRGIFISTLVWMCFDLSLTFGAMYARALMPDANSAYGYFQYALELMPVGLKGFFLAGVLATILSTLDSYLFLAGTTISYDILPKHFSSKRWVHHFCIFLVAVLAVVMSFYFEGNIKKVWKTMGSLMTAGLLIPVLACYLGQKFRRENLFLLSCSVGALTTLIWTVMQMEVNTGVDSLYPGALASLSILLLAKALPASNTQP